MTFTLSAARPSIAIDLAANVGGAVELVSDGTSAPYILDRPADDNPTGARRSIILTPQVVGFDAAPSGHSSTGQSINVTFNSEVAGTAYVGINILQQISGASLWEFGRYDTAAGALNPYADMWWKLNGTNLTGGHHEQRSGVYGTAQKPFNGSAYWHRFCHCWLCADNSNTRRAITLVEGENTLNFGPSFGRGAGAVIASIYIELNPDSTPRAIPRRVVDVEPYMAPARWLDDARAVLNAARTTAKRVLLIGDSILVRDNGWGLFARRRFEAIYGQGGLMQRVGTSGSATLGRDVNAADTTQWITDEAFGAAHSDDSTGGGADYTLLGTGGRGYVWTDGQTGTRVYDVPTGTKKVRLVYEESASGSTLGLSDGTLSDSASTTGTDDVFGAIEITGDIGTTITVSKSTSGGECRIAMIIVEKDAGVVVGRICESGDGLSSSVAATKEAWQSFIAAAEIDLIVWASANEDGETGSYVGDELGSFLEALPYLDEAKIVRGGLYHFQSGGYSTSLTEWTPAPNERFELACDYEAASHFNLGSVQYGWFDFSRAIDYELALQKMFEIDGYASQSTDGDSRDVSDFHPSAAGAEWFGVGIANLIAFGEVDPRTASLRGRPNPSALRGRINIKSIGR